MKAAFKIPESVAAAGDAIITRLYEEYSRKLFNYTRKNYSISEDDACSIVYTTLYRVAAVYGKYSFDNKHKEAGFIFKTHINFLRNYFRLNKNFEYRHVEVALHDDYIAIAEDEVKEEPVELVILKQELEELDEWQRILLLMRGQDIPYSEIAKFVNRPEKQLKVYYARLKNQLLETINKRLEKTLNNGTDQ
jgi:RNA polymerase sigma factor (sigma-70 family)